MSASFPGFTCGHVLRQFRRCVKYDRADTARKNEARAECLAIFRFTSSVSCLEILKTVDAVNVDIVTLFAEVSSC